ncbi:MAG TPA: branched-chain amino acid ABC transporter permease [Streptosporangiaceae bacterium]|nr:branched-chain amino acid ABC transporter permease [Streptosporangiaceae bacterium]
MPGSEQPATAGAQTLWRPTLLARRGHKDVLPDVYRRHDYSSISIFVVIVLAVRTLFVSGLSAQDSYNLWLIYAIAALGFYLVFGVAGRFAFSQTFMMALGAYLAAWLSKSVPVWQAMLYSLAISAVVALILAVLLIRTNEFYFGIATLAIAGIGTLVFQNWTAFAGPSGLVYNIPSIEIGGFVAETETDFFWVMLVGVVVALLVVSLIERSPLRREAIAARDAPMVARTLGIPVAWIQVIMFVLGSVFAAVAGSLYAQWQGVISPDTFGIDLSIGIFLMAILGGLGSMWGVIIGAAFYVFIPQYLQSFSQYQNIIYGGLLVVILILLPEGLVGIAARVRDARRGRAHLTTGPGGNGGVLHWLAEAVSHARSSRS